MSLCSVETEFLFFFIIFYTRSVFYKLVLLSQSVKTPGALRDSGVVSGRGWGVGAAAQGQLNTACIWAEHREATGTRQPRPSGCSQQDHNTRDGLTVSAQESPAQFETQGVQGRLPGTGNI